MKETTVKLGVLVAIILAAARICSGGVTAHGSRYARYLGDTSDDVGGGGGEVEDDAYVDETSLDELERPLSEEELMRAPTDADLDLMADDIDRPEEGGPSIQQGANWPGGVIVYVIDRGIGGSGVQMIRRSMQLISSATCIRFQERRNEPSYVFIQSRGAGCFAYIGRLGSQQILNLGQGHGGTYFTVYTITHELIHVIGFDHEQNRPDRDNYVNIWWQNILPGKDNQFFINRRMQTFGVPYDYTSIMHYRHWEFSRNGRPTITRKQGNQGFSGPSMSSYDIRKIRSKYGCR